MSLTSDVGSDRWRRRPGLARAYRMCVLAGPLLTVLGVAFAAAQLVHPIEGAVATALRWALIAGLALTSAVLADRALARLLPVAALLDLDIGFPGAVPTRPRIASLASLRGRDADLVDLLPGVAGRDLDAAAEHVMVRYASATRSGLRPRSHVDRVRALAVLIAERLGVPAVERDKLQWALLMRELGSIGGDDQHPHQPLVQWLGPWAALVHGPYVTAARSASSPAVRTVARAAAVADAYVVVTATHPYRRPEGPLPLDALSGEHLPADVVDALHGLSEQERRRSVGMTVGVTPMLARYSPRPQPVFAVASIVAALVLAVGGGAGPAPDPELPTQPAVVNRAPAPPRTPPEAAPGPRSVGGQSDRDGGRSKAKASKKPTATPPARGSRLVTARSDAYGAAAYTNPSRGASTGPATGGTTASSPAATSAGGATASPPATAKPSSSSPPSPAPAPSPSPAPAPSPSPAPAPSPTPTPEPPPVEPPPPGPTPDEPAPAPSP